MFFPTGDSPNPPGRPLVNWTLILLNVAVYVWLLPLSFQAADPRDPAFSAYLQAIADERGLEMPEVRQVAHGLSQYDLLVFRHGFHPAAPSVADPGANRTSEGNTNRSPTTCTPSRAPRMSRILPKNSER